VDPGTGGVWLLLDHHDRRGQPAVPARNSVMAAKQSRLAAYLFDRSQGYWVDGS
jgi:hypothetical protein